jgi:hypothetical protein
MRRTSEERGSPLRGRARDERGTKACTERAWREEEWEGRLGQRELNHLCVVAAAVVVAVVVAAAVCIHIVYFTSGVVYTLGVAHMSLFSVHTPHVTHTYKRPRQREHAKKGAATETCTG